MTDFNTGDHALSEDTQPDDATVPALPDGDYAIVEIMGHRTRWGRVEEVERFGATFLRVHSLDGAGDPLVEDYAGSAVFSVRQVPRVAVEAEQARQARRREQEASWREAARSRFLPAPGGVLASPDEWADGIGPDDRIMITEDGLGALRAQAGSDRPAEDNGPSED